MITKLDWFNAYVNMGLQPIAIYKSTKCPVGKEWQKDWSPEKWRPYFSSKDDDDYNIGFLFGKIIDIEGDSKEANELLYNLIGDLPHLMFSSSKSIHHLFLNPGLSSRKFDNIEFRAFKNQSVAPPSIHTNGDKYSWLASSSNTITEMPQSLIDYYHFKLEERFTKKPSKNKKENIKNKKNKKPGYIKTECKLCKNMFYMHRKRLLLEVKAFKEFNSLWMCRGCRKFDVRPSCRIIRKQLEIEANLPYVPYCYD